MAPGLPENSRPYCWDLLHPGTHAQFRSTGTTTIAGFDAHGYDFQVQREDSHWMLHDGSQDVVAAYQGTVWIDPNTARVLRIEMQARDLPSDFPDGSGRNRGRLFVCEDR